MPRQSTAPGPARLVCAVCQTARSPQVMTQVLLQGKRRALCERCYDAWLDEELDLDKLDLDAKPIKAQASSDARPEVLVYLGLRIGNSRDPHALFSLWTPRG